MEFAPAGLAEIRRVGDTMNSNSEKGHPEPRLDDEQLPGYLRQVAMGQDADFYEATSSPDAGSQAWGDYLEEIEGFEI